MFHPVIPFGGFSGWLFLNRTMDSQKSAFEKSPEVMREEEYFKNHIGDVKTADDLVSDRTLLKVALGAFGLSADLDNKFFIKKVLEDGTLASDALANKLSDKRYLKMAQAFGFGDYPIPSTGLSDFGDRITAAYKEREFEVAIGDQNQNFRLALGIERDLTEIAEKDLNEDTLWLSIMGNEPLRQVFETVLNLPSSFAGLDLDKQLETFKDKAFSAFGDSGIKQFADKENREKLTRMFLLRADLQNLNVSTDGSQTALTLLQGRGQSSNLLLV